MAARYKHWTVWETHQASSIVAAKHAGQQGFTCYRPLYQAPPRIIHTRKNHRRISERVRDVRQLFERYLFVQVDNRYEWRSLHSTRGIKGLLGRVDDAHIEWIQSCEDDKSGYVIIPSEEPPVLEPNQPVVGVRGTFEGITGIYVGLGKSSRSSRRVLFNIMNRPVVFEVNAYDLASAAA